METKLTALYQAAYAARPNPYFALGLLALGRTLKAAGSPAADAVTTAGEMLQRNAATPPEQYDTEVYEAQAAAAIARAAEAYAVR